MNKYVPMGQRVREAGDQAVPMLVDILIRAAAQTCAAVDALGDETEPPNLEEIDQRLTNILRILMMGET